LHCQDPQANEPLSSSKNGGFGQNRSIQCSESCPSKRPGQGERTHYIQEPPALDNHMQGERRLYFGNPMQSFRNSSFFGLFHHMMGCCTWLASLVGIATSAHVHPQRNARRKRRLHTVVLIFVDCARWPRHMGHPAGKRPIFPDPSRCAPLQLFE